MGDKFPVGILGATGSVGQKFLELLADHPWFEVVSLCASEGKVGLPYHQGCQWFQNQACPDVFADMPLQSCKPGVPGKLFFSGLDSSVAGGIETDFAENGYFVVSNSRNHRMDTHVPLLIPEVNPEHLELLQYQKGKGKIVTNPNCSTVGLVLALKPLWDAFGLESVQVVTMQALSGAGYPGVSSLDILDNVIPFISGEEEKMQTEPLKIFGQLQNGVINEPPLALSAQCNRVAVMNGHLERVSVKLKNPASIEDVRQVFIEFRSPVEDLDLPSAPESCLTFFDDPLSPQPRKHANLGGGMTVSVGHLSKCPVLDFKFSLLAHNTIRGAAGGAILNAELMLANGLLND